MKRQFSQAHIVAIEVLDNASWEAYAKGRITPETAQLDVLHYEIE